MLALVLGHALFKSALFLVVGVIDRSTGTRDLRELTGLHRRLPVVFVATLLAAASNQEGPGNTVRIVLVVSLIGAALLAWFLLRGYRDNDHND